MGVLDEAIREHLELKRLRGADPSEVFREEHEAFGEVPAEPSTAPTGLDESSGPRDMLDKPSSSRGMLDEPSGARDTPLFDWVQADSAPAACSPEVQAHRAAPTAALSLSEETEEIDMRQVLVSQAKYAGHAPSPGQ